MYFEDADNNKRNKIGTATWIFDYKTYRKHIRTYFKQIYQQTHQIDN